MKKLLLAIAAAPLTLALGCSQEPSIEEANTKLCNDLATFETSLIQLGSLEPGSTVKELKDTEKEVTQSWEAVQASMAEAREARVDNLKRSYEELGKTINNVPGDATLEEAAQTIQASAGEVQAARAEVFAGLNCS